MSETVLKDIGNTLLHTQYVNTSITHLAFFIGATFHNIFVTIHLITIKMKKKNN